MTARKVLEKGDDPGAPATGKGSTVRLTYSHRVAGALIAEKTGAVARSRPFCRNGHRSDGAFGWDGVKLVMLLLMLAGPAMARQPALACVQGQFTAMGFAAGPIDGLWGPRTQSADRAFAQSGTRPANLPSLDSYNASVVCRQLGLMDRSLRRFWPVTDGSAFTVTYAGQRRATRAVLETAFGRAATQQMRTFGVQVPGSVSVLAADQKDDLRNLWQTQLGAKFNEAGFEAIYRQSCGRKGEAGGFASGTAIAICLPDGALDVAADKRFVLETTVSHEWFHTVQRQLVGNPTPESIADPAAFAGPEWLVEGSATYVSLRTALPEAFLDPAFAQLKARLRGRFMDLGRLETYASRATDLEEMYDNGTYAVYLLTQQSGGRSLTRFYEAIGLGQPWKTAFATAFGETPDAFYQRYATLADG